MGWKEILTVTGVAQFGPPDDASDVRKVHGRILTPGLVTTGIPADAPPMMAITGPGLTLPVGQLLPPHAAGQRVRIMVDLEDHSVSDDHPPSDPHFTDDFNRAMQPMLDAMTKSAEVQASGVAVEEERLRMHEQHEQRVWESVLINMLQSMKPKDAAAVADDVLKEWRQRWGPKLQNVATLPARDEEPADE